MVSFKSVLVLLTGVVCLASAEDLTKITDENNKIIDVVKKSMDFYEKTTNAVKESLKEFDQSQQSAEHGKVQSEIQKVENAWTTFKAALEVVEKLPEDLRFKGKTDKGDIEALNKELREKLDSASTHALTYDLALMNYSDVYHINKKTATKDDSYTLKRFQNLVKLAASSAHVMFAGVAVVVAAATLLMA